MNIFNLFKKNTPDNKKSNDNIRHTYKSTNDTQMETAFDLLEEKFIRIDVLITRCKLILQDKYEKVAEKHMQGQTQNQKSCRH